MHKTKESSLQKSPVDSCLAQLSEHETDYQEVVPLGAIFDEIYLFLCNFRSVKEVYRAVHDFYLYFEDGILALEGCTVPDCPPEACHGYVDPISCEYECLGLLANQNQE